MWQVEASHLHNVPFYHITFPTTVTICNYWISDMSDVITTVLLTTVLKRPEYRRLLTRAQQGSDQAVNLVRSNLNCTHNYVTDQVAQGLQERAEGLLNAKQPLLLKQMLAAPPPISKNPTQPLQHEPLLTIISSAARQLNNHVTHLAGFFHLITKRKRKIKKEGRPEAEVHQ